MKIDTQKLQAPFYKPDNTVKVVAQAPLELSDSDKRIIHKAVFIKLPAADAPLNRQNGSQRSMVRPSNKTNQVQRIQTNESEEVAFFRTQIARMYD